MDKWDFWVDSGQKGHFGKKELKSALKGFAEYQKAIENEKDAIVEELAKYAERKGKELYRKADYDGPIDVVVKTKKLSNGRYEIISNGASVLFIEYGTGVYHNLNAFKDREVGGENKLQYSRKDMGARYLPRNIQRRKLIRSKEIKPIGYYGYNDPVQDYKKKTSKELRHDARDYKYVTGNKPSRFKGKVGYLSKGAKDYWFFTTKHGASDVRIGQVATKRNPSGMSAITRGNPPNKILAEKLPEAMKQRAITISKRKFQKAWAKVNR